MSRLARRDDDATRSLAQRGIAALTEVRDIVAPGAVATACYLLVPGQWVAFKTLLAGWGIPVAWGAALAPVVLGGAITGIRWAVRTFRDIEASPEE